MFAVLGRGAKVDVHEVQGEWARIVTAAGQRGYVKSNFLALPGEREQPAAAVPAPNHAAAAPATNHSDAAPAAAADGTELRAATERLRATETELHSANERNKALETELHTAGERTKSLDAEVHDLQGQLSDLKNRPAPAAAPAASAPGVAPEHLQAELARLAAAVESMQHRLDARPAAETALPVSSVLGEDAPPLISAAAVLLGMVGILVGWFLGGTLGRKQERGRRSRIRF